LNTAVLELPVVGGDPVHHGAQLHHRVPAHEGAQQLRARDEPTKLRQVSAGSPMQST
jgi:hypothetical protein